MNLKRNKMKKFLEFIWELIGPAVTFITGIVAGFLGLVWVFTGFGLLILLVLLLHYI